MDLGGTGMFLACSFLIAYDQVPAKDCFVFTEPTTPKALFIATGIVNSNAEFKQKYNSLKIHGYSIDEYMEGATHLFHTDNSLLLYIGKIPTLYKKVTFMR